ncbi:carboxylesterase [Obba rivulosa]|uniref:Carboxylic ester hydrolase n=1 Tax=Obba rivulosa TaxID=1052685 RepID=A0A8E2AVR8_9APHY|nr:carboxylesterase [Obba rivulosa]
MATAHLHDELARFPERVTVQTRFGAIRGGRAANGAAVFLEVPYALPPGRFLDPVPLPADHQYEEKDYVYESSYAVQPTNDGQAAGVPVEDKVGRGEPTENPLFVNVVCPPSFPSATGFPVKVYIHGGFLQFGSPHGLSGQAQHVAAERSEIWVNVGYRLSAFGFLACDHPRVDGNFGFKDQWLALLWVRDNIEAFGGDPNNIQVSGLSAGAHSVHQLLHHASRLPEGEQAPFHSAILQSNSIVISPKTPAELRPQFRALCEALSLNPDGPDILAILRDPELVPWQAITRAIETDALGAQYGTFRGCLDGAWLALSPDPMEWQRSGAFARALRAKGVRSVVVGDLTEEWYLYSIAHAVHSMRDIALNMERYYQEDVVREMMALYRTVPEGAPREEFERLFGEMLSEGQVHLPVRLLARDLAAAGLPVVRYQIRWTPEQLRPLGYVTHGSDRSLWALRLPVLKPDQAAVARTWLDNISAAVVAAENGEARALREVLALNEDKTVVWRPDDRWEDLMRLRIALPGEADA